MNTRTLDWLRARHAWIAALYACFINAIGTPLLFWIGHDIDDIPRLPVLGSAVVGLAGACVLLLRRRHATLASSSWIFVLNNTAVVLCLWFVIPSFAHTGSPWTPFQANKLGMLIVSALAPELWPGLICIAAMALCAAVRMDQISAPSALEEPAVLIVYTLVAVALLILRVRGLQSEYALAQTRVDIDSADELSKRLLVLRDLTNTPLQTIEINVALLKQRCPQEAETTARITRAIERVRGLRTALEATTRKALDDPYRR